MASCLSMKGANKLKPCRQWWFWWWWWWVEEKGRRKAIIVSYVGRSVTLDPQQVKSSNYWRWKLKVKFRFAPWRRMGNWGLDLRIPTLWTGWRWTVSFTPWPPSPPPRETSTGAHWIEWWVEARAPLVAVGKREIYYPAGNLTPILRSSGP
jgi:hypothetical protein